MRHKYYRLQNMARNNEKREKNKYTLEDLEYGENTEKSSQ